MDLEAFFTPARAAIAERESHGERKAESLSFIARRQAAGQAEPASGGMSVLELRLKRAREND